MAKKQTAAAALILGSLGVVFGDIGTSPLYALKILFSLEPANGRLTPALVQGILSLLLWILTLVVSIKYITYIMRADNKGEGGIMALVTLVRRSSLRRKTLFTVIGLAGVALFYGDSVVTPAISVLSAVEGITLVSPSLSSLVLPATLAALVLLFAIQKYGSGTVGKLFGPIMLVWFVTIGAGGLWRVSQHPDILKALSPLVALSFALQHPRASFVALSAIVLAITGAEALYADMGHFGRRPIARAWLLIVFPALLLCYLGQGALLSHDPSTASNPFFLLFPSSLRVPVIVLATLATLIASQAVISGAFSLTKQAIQLNFLPRLLIKQTSNRYVGQIYLPLVNGLLLVLVATLVLAFGSSARLAGAYGVAVSGTLAVDSILFIVTMRQFWHRSLSFVGAYAVIFLTLDALLLAATIPKIRHGGWLPLLLAALVSLVIYIWSQGQRVVARVRRNFEGSLPGFVKQLQANQKLVRLPGQVVYIGHHEGLTPSALRTTVEELGELHEKVVIVYVETSQAAHVPVRERAQFDALGYADGMSQVTITYGFHDIPNVPKTLTSIRSLSPELDFDAHKAVYCISQTRVVPTRQAGLPRWQKRVFALLSRNALSASDYYHLPVSTTIEMSTMVKI